MAYDKQLADRIRELLGGEADLTEKRMFGGLAFLIRGNMAVVVSHRGGLMIRIDPTTADELVAQTDARQVEMRGRPMRGLVHVSASDVRTKRELVRCVNLATRHARSLPAKP